MLAQDEKGRFRDILWMLCWAGGPYEGGPELHFQLCVRNDNREGTPRLDTLKPVCGPTMASPA